LENQPWQGKDMQMKCFERCKRLNAVRSLKLVFIGLVLGGLLIGCSGSSGGDENDMSPPNPTKGSTWDELIWDQGKWG
jgi:hypothetical protein